MKAPSLRSLFSSLLVGHFAAALAGCENTPQITKNEPIETGTTDPSTISAKGFEPFSCAEMLPGAAAALGVDSIELWQFDAEIDEETGRLRAVVDVTRDPVEADGEACALAPSADECFARLAKARAEPLQGGIPSPRVAPGNAAFERFVLTREGQILLVDTEEQLIDLVTPIDSIEKLRFWQRYGGADLSCEYVKRTPSGFELIGSTMVEECPITRRRQLMQITPEGQYRVLQADSDRKTGGCIGRRPAGLASQTTGSDEALARYLERQAYLEGASVEAFERFAHQLESFGAPPGLVAEALRSRDDEARHYALVGALGRRFDHDFACQAPEAAPAVPRSLFAFALENAVEGCVREAWGALLANHQAARASDDAVRFTSALIADDETRHAELAWATHRWLLGCLDVAERQALEAAMNQAAADLFDALASGDELSAHERGLLGLPSPAEASALFGQLSKALLASPLAALARRRLAGIITPPRHATPAYNCRLAYAATPQRRNAATPLRAGQCAPRWRGRADEYVERR